MYPDPYDTIPHGSVVVCTYRMPSVSQPWIHPIRLGVVERADMDAKTWNGHNDERSYCTLTGKVRVNWGGCIQHDAVKDLKAEQWRSAFRNANSRLNAARALLAEARSRADSAGSEGERAGWQGRAIEAEVFVRDAEQQLADLERRASNAAVPREWRR